MLIPIYIYVLSFSLNYKLISKVKILMIFFIITLLFSYTTSSIYDGRSFQRFGAGLSNDMLNLNSDFSVGPYEDGMFFYISCIFYECNLTKAFFFSYFYDLQVVFLKFVKTFNEIIFLPFKFGIIFDSSNIINKDYFFQI